MTTFEKVLTVVVILFVILSAYAMVDDVEKCDQAGGRLVRGTFGFECVRVVR